MRVVFGSIVIEFHLKISARNKKKWLKCGIGRWNGPLLNLKGEKKTIERRFCAWKKVWMGMRGERSMRICEPNVHMHDGLTHQSKKNKWKNDGNGQLGHFLPSTRTLPTSDFPSGEAYFLSFCFNIRETPFLFKLFKRFSSGINLKKKGLRQRVTWSTCADWLTATITSFLYYFLHITLLHIWNTVLTLKPSFSFQIKQIVHLTFNFILT